LSGRLPAFYADPALYDLLHAEGTDDEAWFLDLIARRHGNGGKSALEPACGTGRYLASLLKRGWRVFGYDLSRRMAAYAKKRLAKWGKRARVARGDMRRYRAPGRYDLAFNLLSTFRHLMTDREALAHLRLVAASLNPGGIFVLGLDLAAYGEDQPDEEVWVAGRGRRAARHVMVTEPPERATRRERIINLVSSPGRFLESSYDLRSYDAEEIGRLLERSPFSVAACYGCGGEEAVLGGPERALWLVLKRSSDTRREKPA